MKEIKTYAVFEFGPHIKWKNNFVAFSVVVVVVVVIFDNDPHGIPIAYYILTD